MSGKIVAFDKDWHLKLGTPKEGLQAKARRAVESAERKEIARIVTRARPRLSAIGWADPSEKLVTLEELAEHMRVNTATIRRAEARGELASEPCGKNGKMLRFSRKAIDAYKQLLATKRHG